MLKRWNIAKEDPRRVDVLMRECAVGRLCAQVLSSRGLFSYREAADFLTPGEGLDDPFSILEMDIAAERILRAVDEGERIVVYGDYDCDGVTATAILYTELLTMGADVGYYIPERETEGYGLNKNALRTLAEAGTNLIVTVDNGISAIEEAALAAQLGMDLVITDHHQPGAEIPAACAVVNPHRIGDHSEYKELCGAGVALKLAAALEDGDTEGALERFAELAAIGTVGDVVPLTGENRIIVQRGLAALACTENPGLRALCEAAGRDITKLTAQDIGFMIAPRINAAGRMGSAGLAFELLTCEDETEAQVLAERLCLLNQKRQDAEQQILSQVEEKLAKNPNLLKGRLLVLAGENWSHGVVGIVCARLLEKYAKPVLLMTQDENGLLRGSARSLGEFHLHRALTENAALLVQYGGHKLAAGFSLEKENYAAFRKGMEAYARAEFDLMPRASVQITGVVSGKELTLAAVKELSMFEPFGAENESPVFALQNAVLESVTELSNGRHVKLNVRADGAALSVLCFGMTKAMLPVRIGEAVDIAVSVSVNAFRGTESVSLRLVDMRPAGFDQDKFFNALGYYEKLARGEEVAPAIAKRALATREEAAAVYRLLKADPAAECDAVRLYFAVRRSINYCRLLVLLDILYEAGLIALSPEKKIAVVENPPKADLTATRTYRRIAELAGEVNVGCGLCGAS